MRTERQPSTRIEQTSAPSFTIEVQIHQAKQDSWRYAWDQELQRLRVVGREPGHADLPADLALLTLTEQATIPVYVLAAPGLMPEAVLRVRVLGALQALSGQEEEPATFPLDGWTLLAVPDLSNLPLSWTSLEQLPPDALATFCASVQPQTTSSTPSIILHPAPVVERRLREARLWAKQAQRAAAPQKRAASTREEEQEMVWRVIQELTSEQRAQLMQAQTLEQMAPFLQAEQLIRFVPARFQHTLSRLLLDDERVLAFLQRPLLRSRRGFLGLQSWRSNEGLLLVTDRQLLWLRDFFSPGSSGLTEGFIAHAAPLERLRAVAIWRSGPAPAAIASVLDERSSPYLRFACEFVSQRGSEWFVVHFPPGTATENALGRVASLVQAFVPGSQGEEEHHLCRLPTVEAWIPQGAEAEQLEHLGGIVPETCKQRLRQRLADRLSTTDEEVLVSALVPALEDYQSPVRLVALTRQAVLTLNDVNEKPGRGSGTTRSKSAPEQRYELTQISSAQISSSLFGASLRLFLPQAQGTAHQAVIPFHSPATASFLPLFTRLRQLLGNPLPLCTG